MDSRDGSRSKVMTCEKLDIVKALDQMYEHQKEVQKEDEDANFFLIMVASYDDSEDDEMQFQFMNNPVLTVQNALGLFKGESTTYEDHNDGVPDVS